MRLQDGEQAYPVNVEGSQFWLVADADAAPAVYAALVKNLKRAARLTLTELYPLRAVTSERVE